MSNQLEMSIDFRIATENDKELYRNLYNMYHNDLAPYCSDLVGVDEEGYYDKQTVEDYFIHNESVFPLIVLCDGKIAGLIVLGKSPYCKAGLDYCIHDFFLLSIYRGKGVAETVCNKLMDEYQGKYCLIVLNENIRARKFWDKFISKNAIKINEEKYDEQGILLEFSL